MQFTTHTYLVLKLRISGAIFLILLHVFMAWIGETLPLHGNSGQYHCYMMAARAEFWCNTKLFNILVGAVGFVFDVLFLFSQIESVVILQESFAAVCSCFMRSDVLTALLFEIQVF